MNLELFKYTLKSNYKMLLVFLMIISMYFVIIIGMYDPNGLDILDMLAKMKLPPELLEAFGFTITDSSLVGFISSYFYGLLMIALPMVFYVVLANRLVAGLVDKGSMAHLLASPNSRKKIVVTQLVALVLMLTVMVVYVTGLGIVYSEIRFNGLLDIDKFIMVNVGVLLLHLATSSISFLSSCFFNESRRSLSIGSGLPIFFLLMQMLSNAAKDMPFLKYLTINSLYTPSDVIAGNDILVPWLLLGLIAIGCFGLSVVIFNKKDIPV